TMLWIQSGNLKEGKARAWQEWVQKNDDLLKKSAPPGWTYRGTYFTVLGFGRFSTTWMWECATYGDFDALREHTDETWQRLSEEAGAFFTEDPGESVLLREAGDTKITEPEE
ncbi:MAG: hypothetical protein ACE5EW_05000, partial [Thermoplasmata archaeon]